MHHTKEMNTTYSASEMTKECPACKGTGYILVEEKVEGYGYDETAIFAEPCPECKGGFHKKVREVQKVSNVPVKFTGHCMKDFDWDIYKDPQGNKITLSKGRAIIEKFISDFPKWEKRGMGLYIWSNTKGSGKTFLASCICNELMNTRAMGTKFVSCADLVNLDKSADDKAMDKYERDPIALLCNCRLLFLDDIGAYNDNWTNKILFRILDHRKNNNLPTIITSNVIISQLPLEDRIPDRINDITIAVKLPEYCVRARESNNKKNELYKELNLQ